MYSEQNVAVGVPESEGRRSKPRTMSSTMPLVPLLVESSLKASTVGSGSKVSFFVEQDSKVRVASVRCELIGDMRNMITGFLKNDRMKPSTGRCNDIGGVPARRAWIPLKNRETVLMMHEITVSGADATKPVMFGLAKLDHGKNQARGFGKGPVPARGSAPTDLHVGGASLRWMYTNEAALGLL